MDWRFVVLCALAAWAFVEIAILLAIAVVGAWKYFLVREHDLAERYGRGSWAMISGASRGQGRCWALELASRDFNLVLVGSKTCELVAAEVRRRYPMTVLKVIVVDFCDVLDHPEIFRVIADSVADLDLSICINNVARRSGHAPSHGESAARIKGTIACSLFAQVRLTQIALAKFSSRSKKCAVVSTTALCQHPTFGPGLCGDTTFSLPYLQVYESCNAARFYAACSVWKEHEADPHLDFLIITPGAVLTEKTRPFLAGTFGAVPCEQFIRQAIRLLGHVQGPTCAHWVHAASGYLINLAPWRKDPILRSTSTKIAQHYQHESL